MFIDHYSELGLSFNLFNPPEFTSSNQLTKNTFYKFCSPIHSCCFSSSKGRHRKYRQRVQDSKSETEKENSFWQNQYERPGLQSLQRLCLLPFLHFIFIQFAEILFKLRQKSKVRSNRYDFFFEAGEKSQKMMINGKINSPG